MAASQTEIESQVAELLAKSFDAFCNDISGVFVVDMKCAQHESVSETVKSLKKRFDKLAAVHSVKAEGALNGSFQVVFDHEGLFTLAGIIVMLPEKDILEKTKQGSPKDADAMNDAVAETGNLLVDSWDKVFQNELHGHGSFVRTNTFIGNPWDKPEKKIGLAGDEEFVFAPYEITIKPYPTFKCGVIVPKTILGVVSVSAPEQTGPAEEEPEKKVEEKAEEPEATAEKESPKAIETESENDSEEPKSEEPTEGKVTAAKEDTEEAVETSEDDSDEKAKPAEEKPEAKEVAEKESAPKEEAEAAVEQKSDDADTDAADNAAEEKTHAADESNDQPVSEAIQKLTRSSAVIPAEAVPSLTGEKPTLSSKTISSSICAKDIMQKDVIWAEPDDSIQQALTKIQQNDKGYMMIGRDGALEGIASKSDLTGAISPYLRFVFAKWRRPQDDATLQIKTKWIMSKPVHTIGPETSLPAIIDNMCRLGRRAFPVVDDQSKVLGLVTVFDILKTLLNSNSTISNKDKTPEETPATSD
jgi:CBS domain-containing protein